MLVVISPAKKLDMTRGEHEPQTTIPRLLEQTSTLIESCQSLTRSDLKRLMKLSDKLADLTYERFQAFTATPSENQTRAATLAFRGDTYQGLDADTLSTEDVTYAQDHLRLLSGLYGVLRPQDAMQAYRLEMGTKLPTSRGENLYDFWQNRISEQLDADLSGHPEKTVINAASTEYFTAVNRKSLKARVITPVFKEVSTENGPRTLGLYAKRARGAMARFMIQNRIDRSEDLKNFDWDGYSYSPDTSTEDTWVFQRPQRQKK